MNTITDPREEAALRWRIAELHEALHEPRDWARLEQAIERRLAHEAADRVRRPGRGWLWAAGLLGAIGTVIAFATAVDADRATARRQGRELLDVLRRDASELERVAKHVSYAFDVRHERVAGEQRTRAGEARGHAVVAVRHDRIHIWFDAQVMPWTGGVEPFAMDIGQTVRDGNRCASYIEASGGEQAVLGGQRILPRVYVREAPAPALDGLRYSAPGAPWMSETRHDPSVRTLLERADADSVRAVGGEVLVTIGEPRDCFVLKFERHGQAYVLHERRHVRNDDVAVVRYGGFEHVDGKCWLPSSIDVDSFLTADAESGRHHTRVRLTTLRLDAELAPDTFALVVPDGTACLRDTDHEQPLVGYMNEANPERCGIVFVETDARRAPRPPQATSKPTDGR